MLPKIGILADSTKKNAVEDKILEKNRSSLKKRLLLHPDEDSDEDGNEFTNPVAKAPSLNYVPPPINMS